LEGTLNKSRLLLIALLSVLSKACSKSINILLKSIRYSKHFSYICLTMCIFSIVDLFGLNSIWYLPILHSTISDNFFWISGENTLYITFSNVIPLHYNFLSHFLNKGHIIPSVHSTGISSIIHILWINLCIQFHNFSPPTFISSGVILSDPGALFNFRLFIIPSVSSYAGAGTSILSLFPFLAHSFVSAIIPLLKIL